MANPVIEPGTGTGRAAVQKSGRKGRLRDLRLGLPLVLLTAGVLAPVVLATASGIVALALGSTSLELILGILVVSFASAGVGFAIVVTVLLGKRARTARLQSDLLSTVSHELKTPLAAIRMYAQTLQNPQTLRQPEIVADCVETIARETGRLEVLVERLLTWRTLARGRERLHPVTAPLTQIVRASAERFRRLIPEDEMDLQVHLDSPRWVHHDPQAMGTILLNLLSNAHKYGSGIRRITLSLFDEGPDVVLSVADNGRGFPPGRIPELFKPFRRLDDHGETQGTGLGLAIVHTLVRAQRGRIEVDSTPGQGATFRLVFPAMEGS